MGNVSTCRLFQDYLLNFNGLCICYFILRNRVSLKYEMISGLLWVLSTGLMVDEDIVFLAGSEEARYVSDRLELHRPGSELSNVWTGRQKTENHRDNCPEGRRG